MSCLYISGKPVNVTYFSIESEIARLSKPEYIKQTIETVYSAGGVMVCEMTEKTLEEGRKAGIYLNEEDVNQVKVGYNIYVATEIAERFRPESMNAILDHEIGHLVHGLPEGEGLVVSLHDELAADKYSAKIHGSEAMSNAIVDAINSRVQWLKDFTIAKRGEFPFSVENIIAEELNSEIISARLQVLRHMRK